MLNINNNKIILQAEIPVCGKCIVSDIPFLSNLAEAQNFFPNIEITDAVFLSQCDEKIIGLSAEQLLDFVEQWHDKSSFLKLTQWSVTEWLSDYLHDNLEIASSLKLIGMCGIKGYFPDFVPSYLKSIDLANISKQRFLTIDEDFLPEYSWCVEDYLAHRLHGENSAYKQFIEERIADSYVLTLQMDMLHDIKHGKAVSKSLEANLDLDSVAINESAIDLFCPCDDEFFSTNISHIRKVIHRYISLGGD